MTQQANWGRWDSVLSLSLHPMRKYMLSLWLSWVLELPESGAKRGATIAQIKEAVNIEEAEPRDRALGPCLGPESSQA